MMPHTLERDRAGVLSTKSQWAGGARGRIVRPMIIDTQLARLWHEIAARPDGPMAFRFYLQPLMASLIAIRDGIKDARAGREPYFWSLFTDPAHRAERLRDGWKSIWKIFVLALILDTIYQFVVLGGWRPVEGLVVAEVLAIGPYLALRGPVNRLMSRRLSAR